jgi:DNA-directed RNA polymerase specialized sigma24 family protein
MIEDLLYRIQSRANIDTAKTVIERLPIEFGLLLDLYYEGELTHADIARLLDWSTRMVSQKLTRAITLFTYELHPERFRQALTILSGRANERTKSEVKILNYLVS